MRLPSRTAANENRVAFGRYVARRLRRARLSAEEAEVLAVTDALRAATTAAEDAGYAVQDALADRDAVDSELDDVAKRHRQALEGRGTTANRERPYTDIYPDGIAWYANAPLAEQVKRYELLVRRYHEFLPDGDPVRAEAGVISNAIAEWSTARTAVDQANLNVAMARAKTQVAVDVWEQSLTRLYFRLAERFGKAAAERFFPRPGRTKRAVGTDGDTDSDADGDVGGAGSGPGLGD
jgi:hypothetical protein